MKSLLILWFSLYCFSAWTYSNEKAGFTVDVNGELNPYKIFSTFVMPGSAITIKSAGALTIEAGSLQLTRKSNADWQIVAPAKAGVYKVKVFDAKGAEMNLNILVLTSISEKKGEYLNGYRIGNYPTTPLRGNPIYNRPKGLFEVTSENENLKLTPHFTIKQFLCKQAGNHPKYIIVRERLLLKLEYLLEKVNDNGFKIETFGFISGYRTPFYNASIKNVQYSRHVYGGAADIFIDQNKDGSMDDLNNDKKIDDKDVQIFYNIVEGEFDKPAYDRYRGGLGFYHKNARHNGFIHVDVRGWKSRW